MVDVDVHNLTVLGTKNLPKNERKETKHPKKCDFGHRHYLSICINT
jgi:hypothetical protein